MFQRSHSHKILKANLFCPRQFDKYNNRKTKKKNSAAFVDIVQMD